MPARMVRKYMHNSEINLSGKPKVTGYVRNLSFTRKESRMSCSWKWASSLKYAHIVYAISMFEMGKRSIPVSPLSRVLKVLSTLILASFLKLQPSPWLRGENLSVDNMCKSPLNVDLSLLYYFSLVWLRLPSCELVYMQLGQDWMIRSWGLNEVQLSIKC